MDHAAPPSFFAAASASASAAFTAAADTVAERLPSFERVRLPGGHAERDASIVSLAGAPPECKYERIDGCVRIFSTDGLAQGLQHGRVALCGAFFKCRADALTRLYRNARAPHSERNVARISHECASKRVACCVCIGGVR